MHKYTYLGTDKGIWSSGRKIKRAKETSSAWTTGARQTLYRAVVASRAGKTVFHGHTTYEQQTLIE